MTIFFFFISSSPSSHSSSTSSYIHINPEISQLKNRDKDEDLEIEAIKLLEVG
jgi:hypothetical protein